MKPIDKLIRELEELALPEPDLSDHMTETEQSLLKKGEKAPRTHRMGRQPRFFRSEVDAIRQDQRPVTVIAEAYEVSFDTIQRVLETGRFAGVPYIPKDELHRLVTPQGTHRTMKEFPLKKGGKRGRPFATGRTAPLTKKDIAGILRDKRSNKEIAQAFHVSLSYVKKIRSDNGVTRSALHHDTIGLIREDERDVRIIAETYRVPLQVVESIKRGEFDG